MVTVSYRLVSIINRFHRPVATLEYDATIKRQGNNFVYKYDIWTFSKMFCADVQLLSQS